MSEHLWARPRPVEDDEWQQRWPDSAGWEDQLAQEPVAIAPPAPAADPYANRASFGYRLGAICIDAGAASLAALLAALLADAVGAGDGTTALAAIVAWVVTWVAVTAGVTELTRGATLGKLSGGMRVVHADGGRPLGAGGSIVRDSLLRLLYAVPFFWLVDSAMASGDDRRALRDRMAGTLVLRTRAYGARAGIVSLAATIGVAGTFAAAALTIRDDLRDHDSTGPLPGYTMADRNGFMFDCTRQLGPERCDCIYDYVSTHLPYARWQVGDVYGAVRDGERGC